MRVDGRYAILVDWRGVSGEKADRTAQVAKAQSHKKQLEKQAIMAAGGYAAVAAAEAVRKREELQRQTQKEQERQRRRQEQELLVQEFSSSEGEEDQDLFRDFSDISSEDEVCIIGRCYFQSQLQSVHCNVLTAGRVCCCRMTEFLMKFRDRSLSRKQNWLRWHSMRLRRAEGAQRSGRRLIVRRKRRDEECKRKLEEQCENRAHFMISQEYN